MAEGKFVAYYRVSTARQGRSGLGLEGQRQAVAAYLNGGRWALLAEFTEVVTGKVTKKTKHPQLAAAIAECRLTGATLVIAKLDRLSRNVHFLTGLKQGGIKFVAADMPDANNLTINILASVAEGEAEAISARTKAALAQSTKRLGGYRGGPKVDVAAGLKARQERAAARAIVVRPVVQQMRAENMSLRQIAAALQARGVATARGGRWTAAAVNAVLSAA